MSRAPRVAVLVLLAVASAAAAQDAPDATPAQAPPRAEAPAGETAGPPAYTGPVPTIRPHLTVGVGGGGRLACLSFEAGLRIHPVILLYSGWMYGEDEEYTTFSGFQLGYQHTLARWVAAFAAVGVGVAKYHALDELTPTGRAATLELALLFGEERGLNLASVGVQTVLPFASPDLPAGSTLGGPATLFMVKLNPLLLLRGF